MLLRQFVKFFRPSKKAREVEKQVTARVNAAKLKSAQACAQHSKSCDVLLNKPITLI